MPPEQWHPLPSHSPVPSNPAGTQRSTPKLRLQVGQPFHTKIVPSLASACFLAAGAGALHVGIREGHACKGECKGDQGEEEEEREEGKGLLPGTAVDGNGLQDPHLVLRPPSLGHPDLYFQWFWDTSHSEVFSVLFFLKMTGNHIICVSFFPSSFQRFCERFNQIDVFLINKSRGSYFFSFVLKVGMLSYRQLKTA